jgi:predicted transposase YbfD/YdcC
VVFASSGAAVSWYEREEPYRELVAGTGLPPGGGWPAITHESPVRPENLYGCTKVWGEVLGRHYASATGLTLGQVAVDAKSNEITAIPELLELLDLRDKIVTIDAMGCQKEIATAIVEQGGDYVLAVKENQPTLYAEVQAAFDAALEKGDPGCRSCATEAKGHGREERRIVWVLPARRLASASRAWMGLLSLVMVVRVAACAVTGKETCEVRYFISSLRPSARRLARAIRSHWSIENGLHWVLDVVFREDAQRIYDRTAAQNFAFLNRLAVSLLRGDASPGSLKVKRKAAGWDVKYLAQLLGFSNE